MSWSCGDGESTCSCLPWSFGRGRVPMSRDSMKGPRSATPLSFVRCAELMCLYRQVCALASFIGSLGMQTLDVAHVGSTWALTWRCVVVQVERAILYQTGILMGQAGKDALESFPLSISLQVSMPVFVAAAE